MRQESPGPATPLLAPTVAGRTAGFRCGLGFANSKQSASPVPRNGCWVESASRALKSYTFCGANCPERKNEVVENKGLTERRYRKKYDHIFKSFVFNDF